MTYFALKFAPLNVNLELILTIFAGTLVAWAYVTTIWREGYRSVKYLTKLLGEQYGFCRTRYFVLYDIREDGSATIMYEESLRAINAELHGIEHHTSIPSEPEQIKGQFRISAQGKHSDIEIRPKLILTTPTRLFYQLLFTPPLKPGDTIEYAYTIECPAGTFLDSEQALRQRALPFDYVSIKASYPTQSFQLTVIFPETWLIEGVKSDVWMGDARLELRKEAKRLDQKLEAEKSHGRLFLRLKVAYPILGLKYVISWVPSKKE